MIGIHRGLGGPLEDASAGARESGVVKKCLDGGIVREGEQAGAGEQDVGGLVAGCAGHGSGEPVPRLDQVRRALALRTHLHHTLQLARGL